MVGFYDPLICILLPLKSQANINKANRKKLNNKKFMEPNPYSCLNINKAFDFPVSLNWVIFSLDVGV